MAALAVVRAGDIRRETKMMQEEKLVFSLFSVPAVSELLSQWMGAPAQLIPKGA